MALKRIPTADQTLQLIQDNVDEALRPLQAGPLSGGVFLQGIALSSGKDNLIPHTLGRELRAWILARKVGNASVWEQTTSQLNGRSANARFINLWCSASCTVALWVS